jgi:hypothetical protein
MGKLFGLLAALFFVTAAQAQIPGHSYVKNVLGTYEGFTPNGATQCSSSTTDCISEMLSYAWTNNIRRRPSQPHSSVRWRALDGQTQLNDACGTDATLPPGLRTGAEWVRANMCGDTPLTGGRWSHVALIAETAADARDVHGRRRPHRTFGDAEFLNNPQARCPCVLLLDVSASMSGGPIEGLPTWNCRHSKSPPACLRRASTRVSTTRSVALCQEGAKAPCCTRDEGGPFGAAL